MQGSKIRCKVEEMVTKAKYTKGCQILAEMTTRNTPFEQLNQNARISIVLAYPWGIRKLCIFLKVYEKGDMFVKIVGKTCSLPSVHQEKVANLY